MATANPRLRKPFPACCLLPAVLVGVSGVAFAVEESGGNRPWSVSAAVALSEHYTDNVSLASANERDEFITELTPSIRIQANSASLKGLLDYRVSRLIHADDSAKDRTQNTLNASGVLEAIDDHLFVDFGGSIAQQTVSAFGLLGASNVNDNENLSESSMFRVSPYLRGRLGSFADFEVRYAGSRSKTEANSSLGTVQSDWSASLGGRSQGARFAWLITGLSQRVRYGDRAASESDVANARLTWRPDVDFALWVSGGREANDYTSITKTSYNTSGGGLEWVPGPRTRFSASREKRFFGDSDNAELTHRTARTAFKIGHAESVSVLPNQLSTVSLGTIYDLLYQQFASQYPDPAARAAAVNQFLQLTGIPPGTQITSGFLTTRVSTQKASNVSIALLGLRNTLTLAGQRTESEALTAGILGDDFDNFSNIRQTGVTLSLAHNLSPLTSLNASVARQVTVGQGSTASRTTTRSAQLGLQTKPGPSTGLSLLIRRAESKGASGNYIENSAIGTLSHKF